ncbi:MAG: cytochrome c maturation protein CcmE [Candidatus Nitrospinota bacterium M3_3B_026]
MAKSAKPGAAQKKFLAGAAILVAAIGYLMYTGVKASGSYYYKVSEVLDMGQGAQGASLRLEGRVVEGSIERNTADLELLFNITDESDKSIPVYYKGVTPDMFQDGIDVVVEGTLDKSGKFIATKLLTSCPSKYEASKEVEGSV